jgi:hypothetical protein
MFLFIFAISMNSATCTPLFSFLTSTCEGKKKPQNLVKARKVDRYKSGA